VGSAHPPPWPRNPANFNWLQFFEICGCPCLRIHCYMNRRMCVLLNGTDVRLFMFHQKRVWIFTQLEGEGQVSLGYGTILWERTEVSITFRNDVAPQIIINGMLWVWFENVSSSLFEHPIVNIYEGPRKVRILQHIEHCYVRQVDEIQRVKLEEITQIDIPNWGLWFHPTNREI
jgi:hypothetical protein